MTLAAAVPIPTDPAPVPFAKVPYTQATWTSSERKVYACLRYAFYRWGGRSGSPPDGGPSGAPSISARIATGPPGAVASRRG